MNYLSSFAESGILKTSPALLLACTVWVAEVRESLAQVTGAKGGPVPMEKKQGIPFAQWIFDLADEEFQVREKAYVGLLGRQDDPVILRALKTEMMRTGTVPGYDVHRKKCCFEVHADAREKLLKKYRTECQPGTRFAFGPSSVQYPPGLTRWGPSDGLLIFHKSAIEYMAFTLASPAGVVLTGWEREKQMLLYLDSFQALVLDDAIAKSQNSVELHKRLEAGKNELQRFVSACEGATVREQQKEKKEHMPD